MATLRFASSFFLLCVLQSVYLAAMVFFKYFKKGTMTILEKETDPAEQGTTLDVSTPITHIRAKDNSLHLSSWSRTVSCKLSNFDQSKGAKEKYMTDVVLLSSSHHESESVSSPFQLLSHRIHTGEVQWGPSFKVLGEFSLTEGYWEWLEDVLSRKHPSLTKAGIYKAVFASLFTYDRHGSVVRAFCEHWCPATNTLHTSLGELSISLWDLHRLAGLSISGSFYNEAVPSVEKLSSVNKDGELLYPLSCRHLFLAYHRLCHQNTKGKPSVKISAWINFWYKGSKVYFKHQKKSARNKTQRPKETHNPTGFIGVARERTVEDEAVFNSLGISKDDIEETYLAAFLACWLCKFVFPKGNACTIRPGVFKVASKMVQGYAFNLAVPVLASIYNGLNEISSSLDPGNNAAVFPVHYVYGWLSEYFGTHFDLPNWTHLPRMTRFSGELGAKHFDDSTSRALFRSYRGEKMDRFAKHSDFHDQLVDCSKTPNIDFEYLMSLRSSYLAVRQGEFLIIQPYSPHRFSRQFGYYQDAPGKLKKDIRTGTLADVYKYWESCARYDTESVVTLPIPQSLQEFSVTKAYVDWWSKVYNANLLGEKAEPVTLKCLTPAHKRSSKVKRVKGTECPSDDCVGQPLREDIEEGDVNDGSSSPTSQPQCSPPSPVSDRGTCLVLVSDDECDILDPLQKNDDCVGKRKDTVLESNGSTHSSSECFFKRQRTKSNSLFYDETNSYPLESEAFFDGVPTFSHLLELDEHQDEDDDQAIVESKWITPLEKTPNVEASNHKLTLTNPSIQRTESSYTPSLHTTKVVESRSHSGGRSPLSEAHTSCQVVLPLTPTAEVPIFDVEAIIFKAQRQAASMIGENIKEKVLAASPEQLPLLKEKFEELFNAIVRPGWILLF